MRTRTLTHGITRVLTRATDVHRWEGAGAAPAEPDAFTSGLWTVADTTAGGTVAVTIIGLPASNGSAITNVWYRIDGGIWVDTGDKINFEITGLTNDVEVTVELRAENGIGFSSDSDDKLVTPTLVAGSFMLKADGTSFMLKADGTSKMLKAA